MAFGALSSGISALNSFSKGMEVIGNNIANVNTVSFKSSSIKYSETFNQVLKQSAPSPSSGDRSNVQASQVGLGVQVEGIVGQFTQGGISSTSQLTDLAISGEGFFLVEDPETGTQYATRGGDFRIDDQGYLVTSGGMRVQGLTNGSIGYEVDISADGDWSFRVNEDTQTGTIAPSDYGDIRLDYDKSNAEVVDEEFLSGDQTRNAVMYTNNIIGQLSNGDSSWGTLAFSDEANGILDASSIVYGADSDNLHRVGALVFNATEDPTAITGVTGWHAFMEDGVANLKTLRNVSAEGNLSGIVTDAEIEQAVSSDFFYTMYGSEIDATNDAYIDTYPANYITSEGQAALNAYNTANSTSYTASDLRTDATLAGNVVSDWNSANADSQITDADLFQGPIHIDGNAVRDLLTGSGLTWDDTIDVEGTLDTIMDNFPTSFKEASGVVNAKVREQTPELSRFSVDDEGSVIYFLNNGDSFTRGQIQLVDFNDKTALIREGQNLYSSFGAAGLKDNPYGTNDDGLQIAGTNGLGLIKQGALELSNVDLTTEFANMITTQRGFQAGSRVITVSDEILQEVVNLKR